MLPYREPKRIAHFCLVVLGNHFNAYVLDDRSVALPPAKIVFRNALRSIVPPPLGRTVAVPVSVSVRIADLKASFSQGGFIETHDGSE